MTEFRLPPKGALHRTLVAVCERNGIRRYGFNLLLDRPSLQWFTEAQLLPLNPVLAVLPVYDVAPNVYPAAVFLGIANGIIQQATDEVTKRLRIIESVTAYADSELTVRAA